MENYRSYFSRAPDFKYVLNVDIPGAVPMDDALRSLLEHPGDGIEWEDAMPGMNRLSTSEKLTWIIQDNNTGKKNMDAVQEIERNKVVKIHIENDDTNSLHPMQHAIHIHGVRFLVLSVDGVQNENLVWKDTVNIPVGSAVELLTYFANDGEWMMHCHIAEHLESGMMTSFKVV